MAFFDPAGRPDAGAIARRAAASGVRFHRLWHPVGAAVPALHLSKAHGHESRASVMTRLRASGFAVAFLAFAVRLVLLTRVESEDGRELMAPDSYTYEHLGQSWMSSGAVNSRSLEPLTSRAPGYPGFLALIYGTFGPSRRIAAVGQAVLSALTVLLVYQAGRRIHSHAAGATGAMLLAFDPPSILAANLLLTES